MDGIIALAYAKKLYDLAEGPQGPQGEPGSGAVGTVAEAYSTSKTYAVGDYVIHDEEFYRCTTAITTAEAFNSAHWTKLVLTDDVSDLKSNLKGLEGRTSFDNYYDVNPTIMTGRTSNGLDFDSSQGRITDYVFCAGVPSIRVFGNGNTTGTSYCAVYFYDAAKTRVVDVGYATHGTYVDINVPDGACYVRVQSIYTARDRDVKLGFAVSGKDVASDANGLATHSLYTARHPFNVGTYSNISSSYTFEQSILSSDGSTLPLEIGNTSDFLKISELDGLFLTINNIYPDTYPSVCLYDTNKEFLTILTNLSLNRYEIILNDIIAVDSDAYYMRFTSYNVAPVIESLTRQSADEVLESVIYSPVDLFKEITSELNCSNAYLTNTGYAQAYAQSLCTDFIPIDKYDKVYYQGRCNANGCSLWCVYDANKTKVANRDADLSGLVRMYEIDIAQIAEDNPTAEYIRICSIYDANMHISAFAPTTLPSLNDYLVNQNVLFGKKYVACGDSFTAGDFNQTTFPDTYDSEYQTYKSYPYWIAKRNNMFLVNEAKSGTTMIDNGDNAFSDERYKNIPDDADYITLMFGLNETGYIANIGTINDNTTDTIMGAWNVVLKYIIEHHPYAKIGIIIADSWLASAIRDAMIEVAEYWGIPYLDMRAGKQVPLGINGRLGETISADAIAARNQAFMISSSDGHPNPNAHKYRSTFIEAWMRTL